MKWKNMKLRDIWRKQKTKPIKTSKEYILLKKMFSIDFNYYLIFNSNIPA